MRDADKSSSRRRAGLLGGSGLVVLGWSVLSSAADKPADKPAAKVEVTAPTPPRAPVAPLAIEPPPIEGPAPKPPEPPKLPVAPAAPVASPTGKATGSQAPAGHSPGEAKPDAKVATPENPSGGKAPAAHVGAAPGMTGTPAATAAPAAHGGGHHVAAVAPGKKIDDRLVPRSLTIAALREELRHPPSEQERAALRQERERLEKIAGDVASARGDLKKDTARLEAVLQRVGDGAGLDGAGQTAGAPAASATKLPLDQLAKAMKGMKAIEAANIASRLPRSLAADILQRMSPADAGKVMGQMKPADAAEVTAEIASRQPKGIKR